MKETWVNILQTVGMAWWVEISTEAPRCTYYFGPFASAEEAASAKYGYVEDLNQEGAEGIHVDVKRCRPLRLTVEEQNGHGPSPAFSSP